MRFLFTALLFSISYNIVAQPKTEEVTMFSKMPNNDLKGTLVIPSTGKKFNLVIIQAGSGPTDRNGNSPLGIKANSYRLLANALAEKNIATLLTDKRGIAASAGAMKKEADLRFEDYAKDLGDWIRFARKDKRFKKIFIAGHSEGSLVGMLATQREKAEGFISIAGAGEPIDKIISWQIQKQSPQISGKVDSLLANLKAGEQIDSVPPYLFSLFRLSVQPYMISWMKHDPCAEIKKVRAPVMIIQGTTDIQVEVKEAELLHGCRPNAVYKIIEGMNHVLKAAPLDRQKNMATYNDATLPLMPGLAEAIAEFVKKI